MSGLRFICDEQLGRLAKWLRLQGFDTLFECPIPDSRLIQLAQNEKRVLLTRDQHIAAKTLWEKVVWIQQTLYGRQLRELNEKLHLPPGKIFTRCLECNVLIENVSKKGIEGQVPDTVYEQHARFYKCPSCRKIFWRGSHVKASEDRLKKLKPR